MNRIVEAFYVFLKAQIQFADSEIGTTFKYFSFPFNVFHFIISFSFFLTHFSVYIQNSVTLIFYAKSHFVLREINHNESILK